MNKQQSTSQKLTSQHQPAGPAPNVEAQPTSRLPEIQPSSVGRRERTQRFEAKLMLRLKYVLSINSIGALILGAYFYVEGPKSAAHLIQLQPGFYMDTAMMYTCFYTGIVGLFGVLLFSVHTRSNDK